MGAGLAGETIGTPRHGKLVVEIVQPRRQSREEVFRDRIGKRAKLPKGVTVKGLIEEGRS